MAWVLVCSTSPLWPVINSTVVEQTAHRLIENRVLLNSQGQQFVKHDSGISNTDCPTGAFVLTWISAK